MNLDNAVLNDNFMEYQQQFDWLVDAVPYKNGYLVNDTMHLNRTITTIRMDTMEMALEGKLISKVEDRSFIVEACQALHYVETIDVPNSSTKFICKCNCITFYKKQKCWQSLMVQHRKLLTLRGTKISQQKVIQYKSMKQKENATWKIAKQLHKEFQKAQAKNNNDQN